MASEKIENGWVLSLKPLGYWLVLPILQLLLLVAVGRPEDAIGWQVQLSHLAITIISSFLLFSDRRPYSLYQIFWLFNLVFFGLVPAAHFHFGIMPWRNGDVAPETMLQANLLVLSCSLIFAGVYIFFIKDKTVTRLAAPFTLPTRYAIRYRKLMPWVLGICAIILCYTEGLPGLFMRGHAEEAHQRFSLTTFLLIDKIVRGTLVYFALAGIALHADKKMRGGALLSLIVAIVLLNFPLALPRYFVALLYLALLIAGGLIQRRHTLKLLFLAGLLVVSPLISITRYSLHSPVHVSLSNVADAYEISFAIADFDPYASLCRTMMYTQEKDFTNGKQLLGCALFFVPRSMWPSKPVGSGYTVYQQQGFDFKNVSCTFFAEGYINFGWLGSLIFAFLIAVVAAKYDAYFLNNTNGKVTFLKLFYPLAIGAFFFILRGDLLSSTAYTVGVFAVGWCWHRILQIKL